MRCLAGCLAIIFGSLLLLFILPWAAIQHPSFRGVDYVLQVVVTMFLPSVRPVTLCGLALVVCGISLQVRMVTPRIADTYMSRAGVAVTFCGLVAGLTMGLLAVLVGIAYVTLGA